MVVLFSLINELKNRNSTAELHSSLNCHYNSVHNRREIVTEYWESELIDLSFSRQSSLDVTNHKTFVLYK